LPVHVGVYMLDFLLLAALKDSLCCAEGDRAGAGVAFDLVVPLGGGLGSGGDMGEVVF
jgi:hypothetical protein